jgi:Pro-Pro endopeptidase
VGFVKKWVIVLSIIILSFSFYNISKASEEGLKLSDFDEDSILMKYVTIKPKKQLENIVILPETSFNQKEAAKIVSRLSGLPIPLLEQIDQQGIHVKLFEGKLTDNPTASHLQGIIPRGYQSNTTWDDVPGIGGGKTVLVKIGHSEKGKGHGSVNLELHELAHSIDQYLLKEIKFNRLFLDIWEKERAILFPNHSYFLLFPEEYLAESFALYYLNDQTKDILFKRAPLTYEFISNINNKKSEPNPIIFQ